MYTLYSGNIISAVNSSKMIQFSGKKETVLFRGGFKEIAGKLDQLVLSVGHGL